VAVLAAVVSVPASVGGGTVADESSEPPHPTNVIASTAHSATPVFDRNL